MGKYAILWNNIGLPIWCTPGLVAITIIMVVLSLCVYRRLRRRKFLTPSLGAQLNFGLDVGGTLSKLVYFQPDALVASKTNGRSSSRTPMDIERRRIDSYLMESTTYGKTGKRDTHFQCHNADLGGTLHFIKFETARMDNLANIILTQKLMSATSNSRVCVTGGGAYKFKSMFEQKLHIDFEAGDEFASLVQGIDFMRRADPEEVYYLSKYDFKEPIEKKVYHKLKYPYLVVNIGSGVSMLCVEGAGPPLKRRQRRSSVAEAAAKAAAAMAAVASRASGHSPASSPSSYGTRRASIPLPPASPSMSVSAPPSGASDGFRLSSHASASPLPASANGSPDVSSSSSSSLGMPPPHKRRPHSHASISTPPSQSKNNDTKDNRLPNGVHHHHHDASSPSSPAPSLTTPSTTPISSANGVPSASPSPSPSPRARSNSSDGSGKRKLDTEGWFRRVGGTALGGGTFYGLCRALTGCNSFEEALELAEHGRSSTVNLSVGDIYGGDYPEFGLSAETVAANFGKLVRPGSMQHVTKEDLARAALLMITANIGSLANLYAHRVLNVPQIVFCGNFLTGNNEVALRTLSHACNYWSQGKTQALFLKHEGYLGAIGSLLLTAAEPDSLAPSSSSSA